MKKLSPAFSLIELIIVIGIIAVLSSVLIASFSGGTESARAAKCLNNMRSLAQGVISYSVTTRAKEFPMLAGSLATLEFSGSGKVLKEKPGWISWLSLNDEYGTRHSNRQLLKNYKNLPNLSAYSDDLEQSTFAITNGTLWRSIGGNRDCYVCPEHVIAVQKKKATVNWSYVMNAYFGYDYTDGNTKGFVDAGSKALTDSRVKRERRLMFAELPIYGTGRRIDEGGKASGAEYPTAASTETDCVLQYRSSRFNKRWSGTVEQIAFNHKSNKRYCAHVVFADGHTEKLLKPKEGAGLSEKDLTAMLCAARDIGFDGSSYTWVDTTNDKDESEPGYKQ